MSEKPEREWTLTHSGVLDADVTAGKAEKPDPEKFRPKTEPETWTLGENAIVRFKGDYYYGWSWWRERK